jgi:hypothetical protein
MQRLELVEAMRHLEREMFRKKLKWGTYLCVGAVCPAIATEALGEKEGGQAPIQIPNHVRKPGPEKFAASRSPSVTNNPVYSNWGALSLNLCFRTYYRRFQNCFFSMKVASFQHGWMRGKNVSVIQFVFQILQLLVVRFAQ